MKLNQLIMTQFSRNENNRSILPTLRTDIHDFNIPMKSKQILQNEG